jgi:hypothetical protein
MGQSGKQYPECCRRDCVKRISVYLKRGKLLRELFTVSTNNFFSCRKAIYLHGTDAERKNIGRL